MYRDRELPRLNSEKFRQEVTVLVEEELQRVLVDIDKAVRDEVTRLVPRIVPALLGISDRWGRWEVVQTNGIDKEHPLGIAYREAARSKAEEVVAEAIKDWEPNKAMITAVRKEYNEHLGYMAGEAAQRQAAEDAREWAESFVNDVLDGKFDTPGVPGEAAKAKNDLLREIAEGTLKGKAAMKAAMDVLGEEE